MPRRLLIAVLVLLGVVAAVWLGWRWLTPEPPPMLGEGRFAGDAIRLESPDLELRLLEVQALDRSGFTEWACLFECLEPAGCHAHVRLELVYRSDGGADQMTVSGRLDGDHGATVRVGRIQRPAREVRRVERVALKVKAPYVPGAPTATPRL